MGQSTRLPSAGRPGNCLQSGRSRKYQNVIVRVRYCRDLFYRLRAHPYLRQRGTLKCRIYRRAAGGTTEMLAKIKSIRYRIEPNTPLASPTRAFTLPEAFDVRFYF